MDDNTKEIIQYAEWREKCALYEERIRLLIDKALEQEVYMAETVTKYYDGKEVKYLDLRGSISAGDILHLFNMPHSKEAIEILNAKRAEAGMELIPVEVDVIGECENLEK